MSGAVAWTEHSLHPSGEATAWSPEGSGHEGCLHSNVGSALAGLCIAPNAVTFPCQPQHPLSPIAPVWFKEQAVGSWERLNGLECLIRLQEAQVGSLEAHELPEHRWERAWSNELGVTAEIFWVWPKS